jgi:hypothetical protein
MLKKYRGSRFRKDNGHVDTKNVSPDKVRKVSDICIEDLVEIQLRSLKERYNTDCFDVKQLHNILNVGESNIYELLKNGDIQVLTIGRRKVVSSVNLAVFMVQGTTVLKV